MPGTTTGDSSAPRFGPLSPVEDINLALKRSGFAPFLDERSLEAAIESVCTAFGRITYLKILPPRRGSGLRCGCYLRLDSAAAEAAIRSKFGLSEYAGTIQFFAEVDERWSWYAGRRVGNRG